MSRKETEESEERKRRGMKEKDTGRRKQKLNDNRKGR